MPNKFSRVLFCLLFLTFAFNLVKAQDEKPSDILKKADNYFGLNLFDKAIPLYLNLDNKGALAGQDLHNLGKAMLQASNTDYRVDAKKYLEKVLDGGKFKNDIYYDLGLAYHYSGEYKKASVNYKRYVDLAGDSDFKGIDAKRKVKSAARAEEMIANPKNVTVNNIGSAINTVGMEYNPVLTPDNEMMLFTTRRAGVNGGLRIDGGGNNEELGSYFEDIYLSKLSGVYQWSASSGVDRLNGKGHDACLSMSSSGKKLYLYKSDDKGEGNLYAVNVNGDNFGMPEKMDENFNSVYVESGISVAPKGNVIYFTSNRPGGYGGKDIYVIYKQKGDRWSEPKNMGPRINTQYDDIAPYITPDGKTLYFSSKGHINIGGFDIFETKLENNSWSKPENMGYPINTVYDDAHFYINNDGKEAYISSNRPGGFGSYDIYQVDLFPAENLITLNGNFDDDLAKDDVRAEITVEQTDNDKVWLQQQLTTAENFSVKLQTGNTYKVNIEVEDKEDKEFSFTLSETNEQSMEVLMDINMDEVTIVSNSKKEDEKEEVAEDKEEEIDVEEALKEVLAQKVEETEDSILEVIEDEEFELEEELLEGESIVDAAKRKKREAKEKEKAEKEAIKLAKKEAKDAEKLSEEEVALAAKEAEEKVRAAADKAEQEAKALAQAEKEKAEKEAEELAQTEKEKSEKDPESLGEEELSFYEKEVLAQKERAEKAAQAEKEKAQKAADELAQADKEAAEKTVENAVEGAMSEAEKKAEEEKAFKEEAERIAKQLEDEEDEKRIQEAKAAEEQNAALKAERIKAEAALAMKLAEEKAEQEAIRLAEEEALKKVKPENFITINHIYYGFNGSKLTPESIKQLDELAIVLAVRKELTVILSGHTDNKGSDAYNMILSLNRARAIANYLIGTRGLSAKRFNITGFGENYPIAQNEYENGADNETGRTYNRRTEFKVNTNQLADEYYMEYNRHPFPETMRSSLIYAYYRDFEGVCFRVQLTQSSAPISNKTIAGLEHVMAEDVNGSNAYLAGLFKGYEEAEEYRRKLIKMKGLRNTKVVAYIDGFRATISEAKAHQHTLVK